MVKRGDDILPRSLPPRGLRREEAARYIGVSPAKFDAMVKAGEMPRPKHMGGRRVWDRLALDLAFDSIPDGEPEDSNPWD